MNIEKDNTRHFMPRPNETQTLKEVLGALAFMMENNQIPTVRRH
ncbi:hypothetical protein ACD591_16325 [Rufibacter glacialis]|uniref:Uncharacterized protein n=1 Tax=Rufibacter glacialis TaxID=1259555 RepID=A0ABV4RIK0_9BACT|nr:hypothetical protein [Rufibacter glacialis]